MSTIGEKRVRVEFNPSGSGTVHEIKTQTAQLINLIDNLKGTDPERARCCALAMTAYEEASMWAVKAATS